MGRTPRERFLAERDRIRSIDDDAVRDALDAFADALDAEAVHQDVPAVKDGRIDGRKTFSNNSGKVYLKHVRCAHERGLDLLDAGVETINRFMKDLVTAPDRRRYDLVDPDYEDSIEKPSAAAWQAALRAFYRFCAEPEPGDDRPDVTVPWQAVSGSGGIHMFSQRSEPSVGEEDVPGQVELDAMREACLEGQNTRRDRAFLEVAAGTGQRVYAIVTLLVGDVHLDGTDEHPFPHVLLNKVIKNDGDKGAIERAGGRLRPLVSDPRPVREWIAKHPLRDPDVREKYGAPEAFGDCYLFIGSLKQRKTDPTDHWSESGARGMLNRRKADTANLSGVDTVTKPVNPHVWRAWAYTKSKALPIDEADRRRMFGWAPGSDAGERSYDHTMLGDSAARFAEAWAEAFGDGPAAPAVSEQVVGPLIANLSPEQKDALISQLAADPEFVSDLGDRVVESLD